MTRRDPTLVDPDHHSRGFVVTGRSETDGTGRPFPVLHLRRGEGDQVH